LQTLNSQSANPLFLKDSSLHKSTKIDCAFSKPTTFAYFAKTPFYNHLKIKSIFCPKNRQNQKSTQTAFSVHKKMTFAYFFLHHPIVENPAKNRLFSYISGTYGSCLNFQKSTQINIKTFNDPISLD